MTTHTLESPRYYQLRYLACLFFPCCVTWFLLTGPHSAIGALAWTLPLWFLLLIDGLSPKINPNENKQFLTHHFYDALLLVLSVLQFVIIFLLLRNASVLEWHNADQVLNSLANLIVMRILVGTSSGSSAIIVAHELIHRRHWGWRLLGRLLLYTVCYEHFMIAHLRVHHSKVATPDDIATARLGEHFRTYWQRVYKGHFRCAWQLELQHLGLSSNTLFSFKLLQHAVLQGVFIEITLSIIIIIVFGWLALFIFLYQAYSAVRLLETINYYQHWGLVDGKANHTLAWVNQSLVSEYALVGLANHIDHHRCADIPFYKIAYSEQGPKMPYGYFVTNLWVKLFNDSYRKVSEDILQNYFKKS